VKVYRVIQPNKRGKYWRTDDAQENRTVVEVRHKVKHKVVKLPKMLRKIWSFWL
jgi:hypothetical protein